jgi:hypothetical protein
MAKFRPGICGWNGILIFLLVLFVCNPGRVEAKQKQGDSLKRTLHRIQAGVADSNGWYLAESTGGHFKVKLPAPFNDFEVSGVDENGKQQEIHTVGVLTKDNVKYSATEDVRDTPVEDSFLENFTAKFKRDGTLQQSRQFQYQGHPAIEMSTGDKARAAVMRTIVVKKHVYLLIVEFDAGKQREVQDLVKTFMESFEFPAQDSSLK